MRERKKERVEVNEKGWQNDAYVALRKSYGPMREEDKKISSGGQSGEKQKLQVIKRKSEEPAATPVFAESNYCHCL